jgi:D-alanyl-D-alanine carboxypeptidase
MKIRLSRLQILIILVLLNLILLSGLIFIKSLIDRNSTLFFNGEQMNVFPILAKANVNVNSKAYIVFDQDARVIIAGKNENLRFSPASAAKIMTAVIVLEHFPLDEVLKASNISEVEGSSMDLVEGEEISVLSLLYGMMLPSGNDAAYVLASNFPGGLDKFVKKMNDKAKDLNMLNTRFYDPAGYDDQNFTTALDLARLATFAIKNPNFAKIVSTKNISVTDASGLIVHNLSNLNEMLGRDGIKGIKTGYTDEAGGVLVTSLVHNDRDFIIVVLNSPDRFADTKNVIDEAISKIRLLFY